MTARAPTFHPEGPLEGEDPFALLRHTSRPDVLRYLVAEDSYCLERLRDGEQLRAEIEEELRSLCQGDVPSLEEYPASLLDRLNSQEILLGYRVGREELDPTGTVRASTIDRTGGERFTCSLLTTAGHPLFRLDDCDAHFAWISSTTLLVVRLDTELRPYAVHCISRMGERDEWSLVALCTERDPGFRLSLVSSPTQKAVIIKSESYTSTELSLVRGEYALEREIVWPREEEVRATLVCSQNAMYLLRHDMRSGATSLLRRFFEDLSWSVVHPPAGDAIIEQLVDYQEGAVFVARVGGVREIWRCSDEARPHRVWRAEGSHIEVSELSVSSSDGRHLLFSISSLSRPQRRVEIVCDESKPLLTTHPPGAFQDQRLEESEVMVASTDGKLIPLSLVYDPAHMERPAPLILDVFGAYGNNVNTAFDPYRVPLLRRGFVFAQANIRGSRGFEPRWYVEGRKAGRIQGVRDLQAVVEYLIERGISLPRQIALRTWSGGGVVVGSFLNEAPHLIGAVVARVPFVDPIPTLSDVLFPMTVTEWAEWGNPAVPEELTALQMLSPCDNVTDNQYPAVYVTGALHDVRVGIWEPAKWVARLREHQRGEAPILLRVVPAGHRGVEPPCARYFESSLEQSFLVQALASSQGPKPEPMTNAVQLIKKLT